MFEESRSRNNHAIVLQEGRFLCSSKDPRKEARDWVEKRYGQMAISPSLIVLGLGAGYHIERLVQKFPQKKILVVDRHDYLLKRFKQQFPLIASHCLPIIGDDIGQILKKPEVLRALSGVYRVLSFFPAISQHRKEYYELQTTMLGRNQAGLDYALEGRPDLAEALQEALKQNFRLISSDSLLSIKSIIPQKAIQANTATPQPLMIVKALGELVK